MHIPLQSMNAINTAYRLKQLYEDTSIQIIGLPCAGHTGNGKLIAVDALALLHAVMYLSPVLYLPHTDHQCVLQQQTSMTACTG